METERIVGSRRTQGGSPIRRILNCVGGYLLGVPADRLEPADADSRYFDPIPSRPRLPHVTASAVVAWEQPMLWDHKKPEPVTSDGLPVVERSAVSFGSQPALFTKNLSVASAVPESSLRSGYLAESYTSQERALSMLDIAKFLRLNGSLHGGRGDDQRFVLPQKKISLRFQLTQKGPLHPVLFKGERASSVGGVAAIARGGNA